MNYLLDKGDILIEGIECHLLTHPNDAIFNEFGLVSGGFGYRDIEYIETLLRFENGCKVLDTTGEFPGLWS